MGKCIKSHHLTVVSDLQQSLPLNTMGPSIRRSLSYLYRLFHPHETLPLGCVQHDGSEIHLCIAEEPVQLESLLPDIDLSTIANPIALPEDLVDAVRDLKPFLPIGCEFLGPGDVTIVGTRPINADGFADVWAGKRNNGTVVAIKSHRYHSSSSCLPIYSVRLVLPGHCVSLTGNDR